MKKQNVNMVCLHVLTVKTVVIAHICICLVLKAVVVVAGCAIIIRLRYKYSTAIGCKEGPIRAVGVIDWCTRVA